MEKKVMPTSEPHPAKSYFLANGQFSYSGSQLPNNHLPINNWTIHQTTTRVWGVGSEYCDPLWINHPFATFCQN